MGRLPSDSVMTQYLNEDNPVLAVTGIRLHFPLSAENADISFALREFHPIVLGCTKQRSTPGQHGPILLVSTSWSSGFGGFAVLMVRIIEYALYRKL